MDIHEIFKRPADEPKALRKRVQQLLSETKDPDLKKVVTILETLIQYPSFSSSHVGQGKRS